MRADAVIVAAGSGTRSGLGVAKQFFEVNQKPVLAYTIDVFLSCKDINNIIAVLPEEYFDVHKNYMQSFINSDRVMYIQGGKTRIDSVFSGLKYLKEQKNTEIVCIHDGVRPFVSHEIISNSIACAEQYGAALAAIQITDTVKYVQNGVVEDTLDRSKLFAAQTPQTFNFKLIFDAYEKAMKDGMQFTDDCGVAEYSGVSIHITNGSRKNIKLTLPEDFERLKMEN